MPRAGPDTNTRKNAQRDAGLRAPSNPREMLAPRGGLVTLTGKVRLVSRFFHDSQPGTPLARRRSTTAGGEVVDSVEALDDGARRAARRPAALDGDRHSDRRPGDPRRHDRVPDRRAAAPLHRSEDEPRPEGIHGAHRQARLPSAGLLARPARRRDHAGRASRASGVSPRASERERSLAGTPLGAASSATSSSTSPPSTSTCRRRGRRSPTRRRSAIEAGRTRSRPSTR